MEKRKIGNKEFYPIGMGCMGISHAAGAPMAKADAVKLIRYAADMGYEFFDTGKNYGYQAEPHHNEEVIGEALKGIRDKVFIASKCGVDFDYSIDPDDPPLIYDSSREGIRKSVEGSLERLQTDYIDLYMQARIDPNVEPEEVAATYAELIKEGKILGWGVSEAPLSYLKRANAVCPISAVENSYNIVNRVHEDKIEFLEENGIAWIAHGPLFKGLLTGAFDKNSKFARNDWRGKLVNSSNLDKYQDLIEYLFKLGEEKQATPGQLSIAWLLQRKPYIIPIPGMRKVERLEENYQSVKFTFTEEELREIDRLAK